MSNDELLNLNIINEFTKFINYLQHLVDASKATGDTKTITANTFRLRQTKNSLQIIKKYSKKITLDNIADFAELPGIGKGTIDRIKEIIKTGKLKEIIAFIDTTDENKELLEELESIVGIGRAHALELIKDGITSIDDLKMKIDNGEIKVNDKIKLGIKYHNKFFGNIPRKEIDKIYKMITVIIKKLNKQYKLTDENKYIFEICGSYRREKDTSGDIDILISQLGTTEDNINDINHLLIIVNKLKENIKTNDNKPLIVDDMTDKHFVTKYMGFAQYKNNPFRRIDIRFVPYDSYYSALLYFTGSAELNRKMRQIAKSMKLKLSEYGLTKEDGTRLPITSEYDFFKILKIEYLPPNLR
jgi:DNA polymerase/3'-5' exonuclease PolX